MDKANEIIAKLYGNLSKIMFGQGRTLHWLLAAFSSGGHVLLEDVPGTGKTTLAKALSLSCHADFQRVQFTPDLLPSDILGISIYDQNDSVFRFEAGPVFCNVLLADEINRASPRTQSALLEAMAENQVSIERKIRPLPDPFFVIATQNPVEFHGTYPLPEAQLDRFAMKFSLGYVSNEDEVDILKSQALQHPLQSIKPCISVAEILELKAAVKNVRISDELYHYVVSLVSASRDRTEVKLGASPRASLVLIRCAQALSLIDGFDYVTPESIQELAIPVIAHRLGLDSQSQFSGVDSKSIVRSLIEDVPVPA
ncbi:MAG: MoxR-like ATPase [Gammaproteobacteria bacterium]